jgi:hypothetical protein
MRFSYCFSGLSLPEGGVFCSFASGLVSDLVDAGSAFFSAPTSGPTGPTTAEVKLGDAALSTLPEAGCSSWDLLPDSGATSPDFRGTAGTE